MKVIYTLIILLIPFVGFGQSEIYEPKNELTSYIKIEVEKKINEWQVKGEFEKTSDYKIRVTEKNRKAKIKELQESAIKLLKNDFLNSIDFSNIELREYDADNETFLLKVRPVEVRDFGIFSNSYNNKKSVYVWEYDDFVLRVPINEAKEFKESFSYYKFLNPECVIIDNKLRLSYIEVTKKGGLHTQSSSTFINGKRIDKTETKNVQDKIYTYSLSNPQDYAITEIDYEFTSIEIDGLKSSKITKSSNISSKRLKVGKSIVDKNIPKNTKFKNRYAIIIGNEDYTSFQRTLNSEQNVPYAVNDASIFKEYALKTLGVKDDNLFYLENATSGQMNQTIDLATKIVSKLGNKAELIFYYAGHGFPDELTKEPYLIPVDVSTTYLNNAISLDDLYEKFSKTGAKRVLAFVDACFSGGARENSLLVSRGVKINPKMTNISNNLVVFTASSETQSALPYDEQGHGMFTFYLLNKLKESGGKISLGELYDYISEEVSLNSLKINQTEQEPNVIFSPTIENKWRNWQLY